MASKETDTAEAWPSQWCREWRRLATQGTNVLPMPDVEESAWGCGGSDSSGISALTTRDLR